MKRSYKQSSSDVFGLLLPKADSHKQSETHTVLARFDNCEICGPSDPSYPFMQSSVVCLCAMILGSHVSKLFHCGTSVSQASASSQHAFVRG